MKSIFGVLMILAGILTALYVGVWVMFIGGIVALIESVRAEELIALDVALSVARIFFAGLVGWLSGLPLIVPGMAFLRD